MADSNWKYRELQGMMEQFGWQPRGKRTVMHSCKKIASQISLFLGKLDTHKLPPEAFEIYRIRPKELRALVARSRRMKKKQKGQDPGTPLGIGSICTMHCDGLLYSAVKQRSVVMIEKIHRSVNVAGVSASLDMCPYFSTGTFPGYRRPAHHPAWHATRVHHRCRLLYPPDAWMP